MNSLQVLIVDDESFVCDNLRLKFNRLTHQVNYNLTLCTTPIEALSLSQKSTFDIIFTDIRMPFMNGLTLIHKLRANSYTGKIFVLSGHDDFEYVRKAFLNGADDYLLKPIALSELDERLLKHLPTPNKCSLPSSKLIENNIEHAKHYIHLNYSDVHLNMSDVAESIALSYHHFSHLFKKETGVTFPNYLNNLRIQKSIELLSDPYLKIADISHKVGFKSPQQFSRNFSKVTGFSPSEYLIKATSKI